MHVFFDIDNTLLDHDRAERIAAARIAERYGTGVGDPVAGEAVDFPALWKETAARHADAFLRGEVTLREQRRRTVRELFGEELDDDAADAIFSSYLQIYRRHWSAYPDVEPCLETLGDRVEGVISNGGSFNQREKLRRVGLVDRFAVVVISEDVGVAKPDPEIFRIAAARAGAEAAECLYVGNKLQSDATAAVAAGWRGIWLDRGCGDDGRRAERKVADEWTPGIEIPEGVGVISGLDELPLLLP